MLIERCRSVGLEIAAVSQLRADYVGGARLVAGPARTQSKFLLTFNHHSVELKREITKLSHAIADSRLLAGVILLAFLLYSSLIKSQSLRRGRHWQGKALVDKDLLAMALVGYKAGRGIKPLSGEQKLGSASHWIWH
jgi:hypothetical protein